MSSLFLLVGFCCLTLLPLCYTEDVPGAESIEEGTVFINGRAPIAITDDDFICATLDWWPAEKCNYGSCSWGQASLLNLDLNNNNLLNAVKAFSPFKLRLGGTLQDKVIYHVGDPTQPCPHFFKNNSMMHGFSEGCLPMSRWDELNSFFNKTGAVVVFGLNALYGRTVASNGSVIGPWNSSNAAAFIHYTVSKGYEIYAWELGNELCGDDIGIRIPIAQYASDVTELRSVVYEIYNAFKVKPQIIAPDGVFSRHWYTEFINKSSNVLDVVTHHLYSLGPAVDKHLVEKILDPTHLDKVIKTFKTLKHILKRSSATAWVGEAGGAYNSGRNHVTNAFVSSFWYLDQLGIASKYNTKTYCRQSLIGGNYGLLNTTTFEPNPDYYSALLWKRLMGRKVLSTNFNGTRNLRAYTHCARQSKGIVLLLINLDGNTTVQVRVTPKHVASTGLKLQRVIRGLRKREEYHLTAKDGDLHSHSMLLNGEILSMDFSGNIPSLKPVIANYLQAIRVAPYSIVFAHIPSIELHACRG